MQSLVWCQFWTSSPCYGVFLCNWSVSRLRRINLTQLDLSVLRDAHSNQMLSQVALSWERENTEDRKSYQWVAFFFFFLGENCIRNCNTNLNTSKKSYSLYQLVTVDINIPPKTFKSLSFLLRFKWPHV